jgi:DNA-binding PadR family transcriptional regulator
MPPVQDDPLRSSRRRQRENDVPAESTADQSQQGSPTTDGLLPAAPATAEDSGLDFGFLSDLALKTVYADTSCTTHRAAQRIALSVGVVDTLLQHLYRERFIEIRETISPQNRRYAMLDRGWERVRRLLDLNAYIGAAPVSLTAYTAMVKNQEELRPPVNHDAIRAALASLVLPDSTLQLLGVVANSRRSLFITGAPGNGKTSVARALHSALEGDIWIPRAIEVDGHVINVFDPHNHVPVDPQPAMPYDQRWIKIRRPLVIVGGELTIESMDLTYDQTVKFYEAPFQVKSNGGTLLIDDFGRQRVQPRDLFNRWIIPLENRVDYLTLHTGKKIQIPFEQLLIFASNLDSADLAEEAFLRRLGYRLTTESPGSETYGRIFRKYVEACHLRYDVRLLDGLLERYKHEPREMRSCQPRDLVDRCRDICRYENRQFMLSKELLDRAWLYYFGTRQGSR